MPGLTLVVGDTGNHRAPSTAQSLLLHGKHYRAHSVVAEPGIFLGWVAYDEYPIAVVTGDSWVLYLEGRIYNRPVAAIHTDLLALADAAGRRGDADAAVARFVHQNDGSYVVAAVCRERREVFVFSDLFCRLPLYYSVSDSGLTVAREAKFVHALRPVPAFDRVGCAQFLAFGLPLGDRTVLEGVKSFPEAGLLRVDQSDGSLRWRLRSLHAWNLDDEDHALSMDRQAERFAEMFVTASRNWGSHPHSRGNLVSLSGGHDSRAVAAGLVRAATKLVAVSYRDPNGKRENEVRCASLLAEALRIEWHRVDLPAPAAARYEELAWLKDGMNWTSMAFILTYLEHLASRWGRDWTYLSGDGGDDCLKVTAPRQRFNTVEDLSQYIAEWEHCIPPAQAEAILKLRPGTLYGELRGLLESYPERDLARRIKHFKIFERGRRCYFEGEDRTRFFLWQDSPFYSAPLFRQCMRVPDMHKRYNAFCRHALSALSPAAARVPVVSSGYPPASWSYALYHRVKETVLDLPKPITVLARRLAGRPRETPYAVPRDFATYLRDEFASDSPLGELLDGNEVLKGLSGIGGAHPFFCLWTVAMLEKAYRLRPH
jgi:asparagine synthase (glutamine-hydrolysing)